MIVSPIARFQAEVRLVSRAVDDTKQPARVVVLDAAGERILELCVPLGEVAVEPAEPKPVKGWAFVAHTVYFDGRLIVLPRQPLAVLKMLAESPIPLRAAHLRKAWEGYDVDEGTIRGTVLDLRRRLKHLFPDVADPISNIPGAGYVLAIKGGP